MTQKTAFVLSGGGSLGAVEVGMLQALFEGGVEPDFVVGTSAGAVNAGWVAGRPGIEGTKKLADLWRSVKREDVFPLNPSVGLQGFLGRINHLVPATNLRRLLTTNLVYKRLEDAALPIRVVATDLRTGGEVVLSEGPAVDAIAASAAIPAVFPPVEIDRKVLVDGGVSDNTPISDAVANGATTIYVLPTTHACALETLPRGVIATAMHALSLIVHQRLLIDLAHYKDVVELRVVPPLCPLNVSPLDFSHSAELIAEAYVSTKSWLEAGPLPQDPVAVMSVHEN